MWHGYCNARLLAMTFIHAGPLQAVGSPMLAPHNASAVQLSWTAPFTLPFAIAPPLITYCVDVTNTHPHLPPLHLLSQCQIVGTSSSPKVYRL